MNDSSSSSGRPVHFTYFRGRVALREILLGLGIGPGDEVAVQAYTCLAVPLPILAVGARPVYVDIDRNDLGMDPTDLARKVGPNTRAVIVQHTFGIPADLEALRAVADARGLTLIEDCCHVFGATFGESTVGGWGVAAFYSFEWGKPIVAGVGGGLRVNDQRLLASVRSRAEAMRRPPLLQRIAIEMQYMAYQMVLSGRSYWTVRALYNRLSRLGLLVGTFRGEELDLRPSMEYEWSMAPRSGMRLLRKLKQLDEVIDHHRAITARYEDRLDQAGVPLWPVLSNRNPVFLRYPMRVVDKDSTLSAARRHRIALSGMFKTPVDPLGPDQAVAIGYETGSCREAEYAARSIVSLPVGRRVGEADVERAGRFFEQSSIEFLEDDVGHAAGRV